jgi:hypothetical protein
MQVHYPLDILVFWSLSVLAHFGAITEYVWHLKENVQLFINNALAHWCFLVYTTNLEKFSFSGSSIIHNRYNLSTCLVV